MVAKKYSSDFIIKVVKEYFSGNECLASLESIVLPMECYNNGCWDSNTMVKLLFILFEEATAMILKSNV